MGTRNARLWVIAMALAFLVLWCVSITVAYRSPVQEPLSEPTVSVSRTEKVGIAGWCLVGTGCLGVAITGYLSCRPRRRRRSGRARTVSRGSRRSGNPIFSPTPAHRYQYVSERRR